jgi:hypothetical protein
MGEASFSPFYDMLTELPPILALSIFLLVLLALLFAWLFILAWQQRRWATSYHATAKRMLTDDSLLLFILEPDYVDTLAPLPRPISQVAGEQRVVMSLVARVQHFIRHYGRYQRALLLWRERYAPQPDWRSSFWLFLQLTGLAVATFWLVFILTGLGAIYFPFLAVFPLTGLILLKRQARSFGLTMAVFEELTGDAAG